MEQKLTEDQINEIEKTNKKFYQGKLPLLRVHAEYVELLATIAEARIRQIQADHSFVQFSNQQRDLQKKSEEEAKQDVSN